jgi:tetratricopeptide (TPR) repeat protein
MKSSVDTKLKLYDRTISSARATDNTHYLKAGCLKELGRVDEALKSYDDAIKLSPQLIYFVDKTRALIELKRYAEALDELHKIDFNLAKAEKRDSIDLYIGDQLKCMFQSQEMKDLDHASNNSLLSGEYSELFA